MMSRIEKSVWYLLYAYVESGFSSGSGSSLSPFSVSAQFPYTYIICINIYIVVKLWLRIRREPLYPQKLLISICIHNSRMRITEYYNIVREYPKEPH
jgi:hypothetical protein